MIHSDILQSASNRVHYTHPEFSLFIRQEDFAAKKNTQTLPHWHDQFEWFQILTGSVYYRINGNEYLLYPGDIIFINSCHMHETYLKEGESSSVFNLVLIDPKMIQNPFIHQSIIDPMISNRHFSHFIVRSDDIDHPVFTRLIDEIMYIQETKEEGYALDLISCAARMIKQIFLAYRKVYPELHNEDSEEQALLNQMVDYIYQNYAEPITLKAIADSGGMSISTCCRLFKKYLRSSPISYLNKYRLEIGCQLLKESEASIAEIASSCGFNQQSYFNRLFRRIYSMTPLQYRHSDLRATQH